MPEDSTTCLTSGDGAAGNSVTRGIMEYEASLEYSALVSAWAARDDLYARQPKMLDANGIRAIRRNRADEAARSGMEEGDRMHAIAKARHWWPPEHGQ